MNKVFRLIGAGSAALLITVASAPLVQAGEEARVIPAPASDIAESGTATAVFAGGCFWGVQGVFEHVKGVVRATSGYAGGPADKASYWTVGTGKSGHAEAVQIVYDPGQISYGQLMQIFFSVVHNPTELNYQGPDHGSQYRSAIFATSVAQTAAAKAYIAQLSASGVYGGALVTKVEVGRSFYPAEAQHQDYLVLHPDAGYIVANDLPKVAAMKALFPALYAAKPVLVNATQ